MSENVTEVAGPERSPHAPVPRAWLAPLLSTLVTLPLAFFAYIVVVFSVMACDSCTDADSDRFDSSWDIAFPVYGFGQVVTLGLLIASWSVPAQLRYRGRRMAFAWLAPLSVLGLYVVFWMLIDWP
ncbi:hypothetical protein P8605_20225 [Streptomyces sp. T-3]|nr:hypothetical protein [Streptomyces sp. T-3]